MDKEYFAFISYKSEDVEWAIWVQHELEHYHLPASYNGRTDSRRWKYCAIQQFIPIPNWMRGW